MNVAMDTQFQEYALEAVTDGGDSWTLRVDGGACLNVTKIPGVEPQTGQQVRFYGKGFGYPVRGVTVEGRVLYYRTAEEEDERHRQWCEDEARKKRERYEANRDDFNLRVAALPAPFRERIERFRAVLGDRFRHEYEPYELFCCEEAVRMADHFKTAEAVAEYSKIKDWSEQMAAFKADEGHSGNTFGKSVRLAWLSLHDPALVVKDHAAMCPLAGCKDAGCWAAYSEKEAANA